MDRSVVGTVLERWNRSPLAVLALAAVVLASGGILTFAQDAGAARQADGVPMASPYSIPAGEAGFYYLKDATIVTDRSGDDAELKVFVRHASQPDNRQPDPAVQTRLDAGESFQFDAFLGYLDAGDSVHVTLGGKPAVSGGGTEIRYRIEKTPAIAVSTFPRDAAKASPTLDAPAGWMLVSGVDASDFAARYRSIAHPSDAWFDLQADAARVTFQANVDAPDAVVAFRVPHTGYYALHEASASGTGTARIYTARNSQPTRQVDLSTSPASLNTDLGYIEKGEVIYIAFAPAGNAADAVEFSGTVVEWAPRRAPLRAKRGADGYLDIIEPEAQDVLVDVPANRWIAVPASDGDQTAAIRDAIEKAKSISASGGYAGIRLESGKSYTIGSAMDAGDMFTFRDATNFIFDGNGATLVVATRELARRGVNLFTAASGRNQLIADLIVESAPGRLNFTIGTIIAVSPTVGNGNTITVRLDEGAPDPLKEIARNGNAGVYTYDPNIPGRMALGVWSHFPNTGEGIKPTDDPRVFTHQVTRTNNSIKVGYKWLIKNKGAGVVYLVTRGNVENVTMQNVECRAPGGGMLRFWQTSGVNLINSRMEPQGNNWISSSADGIHGRGREGVWVEDTILRGICEDIMNTYGQTMLVLPDDNPDDNVMSIRMFNRGGQQGGSARDLSREAIAPGDKLVFFNPANGRILGSAIAREISEGRVTLSNSVPGIDFWQPGDGARSTIVYNDDAAARFYVRDCRMTDSMRYGIYIKARGGVIFNTVFDGLGSPAIFIVNEPEWPEGPPGTNIWIQGNTFSQNNTSYMSRNRAFLNVDPADISIYTRHFRTPDAPNDYRAFLTHGQYANSHMKIIGNTFHDWRGMAISVRNSRNVTVKDNLFLPPAEDPVVRETLSGDDTLRGKFAALFMDSVSGARVAGNRFFGFSPNEQTIAKTAEAADVEAADNVTLKLNDEALVAVLHFGEWFGDTTANDARGGKADPASVKGAARIAGRIGGAVSFDGKGSSVAVPASSLGSGSSLTGFTLALWVRPAEGGATTQTIASAGDADGGFALAVVDGRLVASAWDAGKTATLDLGPAVSGGVWQHVALTYDAQTGSLVGSVNGVEAAATKSGVPSRLAGFSSGLSLGVNAAAVKIGDRTVDPGAGAYAGAVDELYFFVKPQSAERIASLALQLRPAGK